MKKFQSQIQTQGTKTQYQGTKAGFFGSTVGFYTQKFHKGLFGQSKGRCTCI